MQKVKQHTSLFFLAVFILVKLAGLHQFSHSESDEHHNDCDICEFVITANTTPFMANDSVAIEQPIANNFKTITYYSHAYFYSKSYLDTSLFSRPPPTA